ncbi:DUF2637 domain-containing protein [Streptomyces caniscabiei]|uniref:DUF2637 domain-containing protein n=1 Tax=Streptomyces caniscabiei TaxID=2746961 RepID=A0A927L8Y0_9ACTN|nr:DUF2637 domain-containing protein [Streptomyces caniscabiei]MBD9727547.1 DUF2637 domain-containing protein [Streptomyces caniscabiei]MDX3513048.1 DUF2637 domain-containing protein [Streptomyces caniscabiei]MDX3722086.1 DUF2637 domain-containing protein [Streptomyces caniscabiei]WEO25027.1 DUF2637 domain-containing protein [Streptomyces caniscabiei]
MAAPMQLTRMHRVLIGVVVFGAVIIAGIGFAGSYAAVRELAVQKGFGNFSYVFPIGIDAGICVLLALDLLLTWIRIPFPLLRQTAWLLTAATIAFNGAAAWPDPLGVGMHSVIPILFVVSVEAARHAVGRIADITADKHMEGVRLTRWLLSPVPTFLLWRRMKLWELRSYDQVIKLEQERLVYQARLRSRYGRAWRRKAPVESLMPLRLARYGVPLAETAPAGLAAAGIEPALLPPVPQVEVAPAAGNRAVGEARVGAAASPSEQRPELESTPTRQRPEHAEHQRQGHAEQEPPVDESPWLHARHPQEVPYQGGYDPSYEPEEQYEGWYEEQDPEHYGQNGAYEQYQRFEPDPRDPRFQQQQFEAPELRGPEPQGPGLRSPEPSPEETGSFPIPAGPNRTRELGEGGGTPGPSEEDYYQVFRENTKGGNGAPTPRALIADIEATYGVTLEEAEAKRMVNRFSNRLNAELTDEHIA